MDLATLFGDHCAIVGMIHVDALPGTPRDQARQRAQAALARQPEFAHPFHWAAFVLVGSGK